MEVNARAHPFPHATCPSLMSAPDASKVLRWMQSNAPWRLKVASFYEQWELPIDVEVLPPELGFVASKSFVDTLRDSMVGVLTRHPVDLVEITAHRLVPGQTIRIHNDFIDGQETHRVLIQLNGGWNDKNGGMLLLFGSASNRDVKRIVRPVHGSSFAFEISPASFHAVSTIHGGERFTLVYSFKARQDDR